MDHCTKPTGRMPDFFTSSSYVTVQSGTVAAGVAVGNTLAYVAPQLAGAIDVVVVKQPDGSLKSSPFYGKNLSQTSTVLIWERRGLHQ